MTGSARQSYYEIALTNRQVLTVFVILLVSVLAAFLSGVWVGRRGSTPQVETVEAQAIEAAAQPGTEPLERLDFFSRNGPAAAEPPAASADRPVGPPATGPQASAEPTPAEPAPAEPAPAEPAPARPTPAEPAPAEPTPAEPAPTEPAPTERRAAAAPPAEQRAAPEPAPETPAAAPAAGGLVVQVFSSNNQVQAQGVVDRLRAGGYPALLSPVEVGGRTMYRVRIGPYADRQVAEGIAEQVRRDYRLETWITE